MAIREPSTLERSDKESRCEACYLGGGTHLVLLTEPLVSFIRTPTKVPMVILSLHHKFRPDTERL